MAITRTQEARALSADERALVDQSHHPTLQELSDKALADLLGALRERRAKAKTQAQQRRREMRGKADARGVRASTADHGSQLKLSVLSMAVRRLNAEQKRRRRMSARLATMHGARKALALKQASVKQDESFNTRTAHQGMRSISRTKPRNLINPMERGRLRKAHAKAQAKADARPSG